MKITEGRTGDFSRSLLCSRLITSKPSISSIRTSINIISKPPLPLNSSTPLLYSVTSASGRIFLHKAARLDSIWGSSSQIAIRSIIILLFPCSDCVTVPFLIISLQKFSKNRLQQWIFAPLNHFFRSVRQKRRPDWIVTNCYDFTIILTRSQRICNESHMEM